MRERLDKNSCRFPTLASKKTWGTDPQGIDHELPLPTVQSLPTHIIQTLLIFYNSLLRRARFRRLEGSNAVLRHLSGAHMRARRGGGVVAVPLPPQPPSSKHHATSMNISQRNMYQQYVAARVFVSTQTKTCSIYTKTKQETSESDGRPVHTTSTSHQSLKMSRGTDLFLAHAGRQASIPGSLPPCAAK